MKNANVLVLCGGAGIHLGSGRTSKGLVPVAGAPLFVHVLRMYLDAGFQRFTLCAGFQIDGYEATLRGSLGARDLGASAFEILHEGRPASIRLLPTGDDTPTGDRIARALATSPATTSSATTSWATTSSEDSSFVAVTYSDTLAALDLGDVVRFHEAGGRLATLVGARVPVRFRVLGLRHGEDVVRGFAARPVIQNDFINGGFYLFDRRALAPPYFPEGPGVVLETAVLERLASEGQLGAYLYPGNWQYLDAERHLASLSKLVAERWPERGGT